MIPNVMSWVNPQPKEKSLTELTLEALARPKEKSKPGSLEALTLEALGKLQHTTKDIKPAWQYMTTSNGESFAYLEKAKKRPGDRTMIDIIQEQLENAELESGWPLSGLQEALKKLTTTRRRSRLDNH